MSQVAGELPRLSAELEAAAVRALRNDWESLNYNHFRNALRPPQIALSDAPGRLGRWSPSDRSIEIGRQLVLGHPWGVVTEVLKHEMAHQYAHEVLHAFDETAHGEAFRRTCRSLGIDPAASGVPRAGGPIPDEEARVLNRVARLLALAGSPNQHEAELAAREAQRLMLKHNLHEAQAGRRHLYAFRHLGEPTGRLQGYQRILGSILNDHFFVEVIWVTVHRPLEGRPGTVMEVCGTDANLEMASYVHDYLLGTAERLWQEHRRRTGLRSDAPRRSYMTGVMQGFHQKLGEQARQSKEEGLVWVGDPALRAFYDTRHPRRRSLRGGVGGDPHAFAEGQKAGREINLHRPVAQGPGAAGGRALPPRR